MKLANKPRRKVQHVMVFGDPKTGKTTLAAKLAEAGYKLIWVSLDSGHEILWKLSDEAKANVELIEIPDTKEMPVGIVTCLQLISGALVSICDHHGVKDCGTCKAKKASFTSVNFNNLEPDTIVVFDHVSQLASSAIAYITKGKSEEYKLDYDDWRTQGNYLSKFFTNVQQARYNIICLAHVLEAENDEGKKKLVPEVGTRNFSVGVGKYFDHIVYCTLNNMKHRFGSATTFMNSISTGSRSDVALEKMGDEPSLLPIFEGLLISQHDKENMNGGHLVAGSSDSSTVGSTMDDVNNVGDPEVKSIDQTEQTVEVDITDIEKMEQRSVESMAVTTGLLSPEKELTPLEKYKLRLAGLRQK